MCFEWITFHSVFTRHSSRPDKFPLRLGQSSKKRSKALKAIDSFFRLFDRCRLLRKLFFLKMGKDTSVRERLYLNIFVSQSGVQGRIPESLNFCLPDRERISISQNGRRKEQSERRFKSPRENTRRSRDEYFFGKESLLFGSL